MSSMITGLYFSPIVRASVPVWHLPLDAILTASRRPSASSYSPHSRAAPSSLNPLPRDT